MHPRRTAFARSKHKFTQGYWSPPPATHTPPASDAPPPHDQSDEPPDPSSSSASSSPPPAITDYLPGASEAVLSTWFWDLHPTEKKDVLTVTHDELLTALSQSTQLPLPQQQLDERLTAVLNDREYVTSVRRAFVNAMHNEALIEPAAIAPCTAIPIPVSSLDTAQLHPVSRAMLHLMTQHLQTAHYIKRAVIRLTIIIIFYLLYLSQLSAFIRYPTTLALLPVLYAATAQTAGPSSAPDPLPLVRTIQRAMTGAVLSLFDESLVRESVDTCCVWLLLVSWTGHHSARYFAFLCCTAALPLIVLSVHGSWTKLGRVITLPNQVVVFFVTLYVLYLSWYSYSSFLFTVLFFFPSLATIALSSLVFVGAAAFPILSYGQSFIYTFSSHPVLYIALYIISLLLSLYYYLISPSYLLLSLALLSSALFLPPLLSGGLTIGLASFGQLVATHGLLRLVVLCGELVMLLLLAGAVVVLDWLLRRGVVWLDKRGWLDGSVGRWWAIVLRWCMETKAVKAAREWLQQRTQTASTSSDGSARQGEG